jgi:hypothetical protein
MLRAGSVPELTRLLHEASVLSGIKGAFGGFAALRVPPFFPPVVFPFPFPAQVPKIAADRVLFRAVVGEGRTT